MDKVGHGHVIVLDFYEIVFCSISLDPYVPVLIDGLILSPDKFVLVSESFDQLNFDEKDSNLCCIPDLFTDWVHLHVYRNPVRKITHDLCNDASFVSRWSISDSHVFDLLIEL